MIYLLLKLVHVISVTLFLGNIITGLFWATQAHQTRDFRLIAATFRSIIRSDRWFTGPGVAGIVAGGMAAAIHGRIPILGTGWVLWSIVMISLSGIIFAIRVAPLQRQILALASAAVPAAETRWAEYVALYRRWEYFGLLATVTPLVAVVLMVLKPPLPAL